MNSKHQRTERASAQERGERERGKNTKQKSLMRGVGMNELSKRAARGALCAWVAATESSHPEAGRNKERRGGEARSTREGLEGRRKRRGEGGEEGGKGGVAGRVACMRRTANRVTLGTADALAVCLCLRLPVVINRCATNFGAVVELLHGWLRPRPESREIRVRRTAIVVRVPNREGSECLHIAHHHRPRVGIRVDSCCTRPKKTRSARIQMESVLFFCKRISHVALLLASALAPERLR